MDNLSKIQRYKKLKENPELYLPKEFDRVDKDLETLNENDNKLAESISILENTKVDKSSIEELYTTIHDIELIPPEKGDKGDTGEKGDKGDKGDTTIVEKVIEKTTETIIKEVPIVTENIVEIIKEDVSGETIIDRINKTNLKIDSDRFDLPLIKNYDDDIDTLQNRTQLLAQIASAPKETYHDSTLTGDGKQSNPLGLNFGGYDGFVPFTNPGEIPGTTGSVIGTIADILDPNANMNGFTANNSYAGILTLESISDVVYRRKLSFDLSLFNNPENDVEFIVTAPAKSGTMAMLDDIPTPPSGATDTFTSQDGKTVTVVNGIVTSIV